MVNSDIVRALIVMEAWREGKPYGGNAVPAAIAWCLANRVRSGMTDWMGVVRDADVYKQGDPQPMDYPNIWDAGFLALVQGINDIYDGRGNDVSCGALFYCDTSKPISEWFQRNVINNPSLARVMQQNALMFYGPKESSKSW